MTVNFFSILVKIMSKMLNNDGPFDGTSFIENRKTPPIHLLVWYSCQPAFLVKRSQLCISAFEEVDVCLNLSSPGSRLIRDRPASQAKGIGNRTGAPSVLLKLSHKLFDDSDH